MVNDVLRHNQSNSAQMLLPEQRLEILGQFCPAGVAWVHGDEDAHTGDHLDHLAHEVEYFLLVADGILYCFHL